MGQAGLLSHRIKLLQDIDLIFLFIEVILKKHDLAEAGSSNSICTSLSTEGLLGKSFQLHKSESFKTQH